ncbi:MAG: Spy/CpxP family protein refolding chaperone [Heliobacteriaceae bacterium]|jgi:Spy/CpxP family protein refolding chaperone|nr:Spy/CpxP family protein refolding chaperone [Heliobacteriaceae bacterium]
MKGRIMLKKTLILASVVTFAAVTAAYAGEAGKPCDCDCDCKKPEVNCLKKGPQFDEAKKAEFKAEMQKRQEEFETRLKLTAEQKEQWRSLREQEHEDIAVLVKKLEAKKAEIEKVTSSKLSQAAKDAKIEKIRAEKEAVKAQIKEIREKGRTEFEAILTPKQKKELEKIKLEGKKKFEERQKAKGCKKAFPKPEKE